MRYVYGVVRSGHPGTNQHGIDPRGGAVTLVDSARLAAAVSDVAGDLEITEDAARVHLNVLIDLLRTGPVLPVRLGTVVDTDADIRNDVLDANAAHLDRLLDAFADVVEVHVDADDDEAEALTAVASVPGLRGSRTSDLGEAIEQGRQIAAALMARRAHLAEQVVNRLRPLSVDDVPRATIRGPEDPTLRWAFLVRRGDLRLLDETIIALRGEFPTLNFRYVGPLPPSHFLDRAGGAEAASEQDAFSNDSQWGW
jgi:hypothetical protein